MLLVKRKETFTISEALDYFRAKENIGEYVATKINRDKKLNAMTAFVLASFMYCKKAFATNTNDALNKVDTAGSTMLAIVRTVGYWVCIIMCVIEILRALMQGDTKGIGKIIIKYILAFAAFYFLPWLFDIIKEIFA